MKARKVTMGIKSLREGLRDFADTFKAIQHGEQVKPLPEGIYTSPTLRHSVKP